MSTTPDEETRAEQWREQRRTRVLFQRQLWLSLLAPPGPRQALYNAWQPMVAWFAERNFSIPPEDDV